MAGLSDPSHPPKLAPVIVAYTPQALREVQETHEGQNPLVVRMWVPADRKKYAELIF